MSCGRVLGHGLYCSEGYECGSCLEIRNLKSFVAKVAGCSNSCHQLNTDEGVPSDVWEIIEEAQAMVDKEIKLPPEKVEEIVGLGRSMTASEAIQAEEDDNILRAIGRAIEKAKREGEGEPDKTVPLLKPQHLTEGYTLQKKED
jgi:hypothetical protein